MRRTLRRSCAACAKAKLRCDLQTPRCSRCATRNYASCVYANQPLVSRTTDGTRHQSNSPLWTPMKPGHSSSELSTFSAVIGARDLDPFDTYPATSLPRSRVQGLIHHFLSKIAFQYYPLDLNPDSNPFIISWWPLALADPALFHVSLQTACLDDELQAQKGFIQSEILMRDAVSLVRRKVTDPTLAFHDATMDAVITMAAIEHGKGNFNLSTIHIDAVKRMVDVRGGLSKVKESSQLTARMVPWVSMLVMGCPQFQLQDDFGFGDGSPPSDSLQSSERSHPNLLRISDLGLDPTIEDTLIRLRVTFSQMEKSNPEGVSKTLTTTELHELASLVLHKLLNLTSYDPGPNSVSECIRYATCIYMFIIHGPTYYSHATILGNIVLRLRDHLGILLSSSHYQYPLILWLLSVGLVGSLGMESHRWFANQTASLCATFDVRSWDHAEIALQSVLWYKAKQASLFRQVWVQTIESSSSCLDVVGAAIAGDPLWPVISSPREA